MARLCETAIPARLHGPKAGRGCILIREAVIIAVHPGRRTVDIVDVHTGWRAAEVLVASTALSSLGGSWSALDVPPPASEAAAGLTTMGTGGGRTMVALYDLCRGGTPVVLAFVHPLNGLAVTTDADRDFDLHASGTYSTTAADGSMEVVHGPSQSFLRIGPGSAHIAPGGFPPPPAAGAAPAFTAHFPMWSLVVDAAGNGVATFASLKVVGPTEFASLVTLDAGATAPTADIVSKGTVLHTHLHINGGGSGDSGPPA